MGLIVGSQDGPVSGAERPTAIPSYDGRLFGPADPVPGSVVGRYHQRDDLVWAEFSGDRVRTGRLVGVRDEAGVIDAGYCQIMADGEVVAGRCRSTPSVLPDGRLRLTEHWRRADGSSGVSQIDELADPASAGSMIGHNGATEGEPQ